MKREEFLKQFLGALGAKEIKFSKILSDQISGTVIYRLGAPEECQDFCWHFPEENELPENVYKLAKIIHEKELLDIDKLILSRDELREEFKKEYKIDITKDDFNQIIDSLEDIEINMVDDGIETDVFIIHE